jgi:hypothetical protein
MTLPTALYDLIATIVLLGCWLEATVVPGPAACSRLF